MSNNKPISYDSWKYILKHMDPNLRFEFVQRCPSVATVDGLVPLKIRKLQFESNHFIVNDTTYTIGVIQYYRNGETPELIEQRNEKGGLTIDVDRYGIDVRETDENDEQKVEQLEVFKKKEEARKSRLYKIRGLGVIQRRKASGRAYDNIKKCSLDLISYTLRKENAEPPFEQYLQLRIKCGKRFRRECVNYDRPFLNAKEYILNKLFGVNGRTVVVLHLQIGTSKIRNPLLPLAPEKLEVCHLKAQIDLERVMESVKPILWEKPLKSLECSFRILSQGIRQDPFITESERVSVSDKPTVDTLFEFINKKVHIEIWHFVREEMKNFIKDWPKRRFEIGREFSIGFRTAKSTESFLNVVEEMPNAKRREMEEIRFTAFPDCIILPIKDYSELIVYGAKTSVNEKIYCECPFIVKIKVQERGCF